MADTDEGATPDTDTNEPTGDTNTDANDDNGEGEGGDNGAGQDSGGAKPQGDQPKPTDQPLGEAGKRALQAERKARQEAEQELKRLRDEAAKNTKAADTAKQTDDNAKSEVQQLAEQLKELQDKHATAELRALRSEVARTTGVPVELLTATTETELTAQAEALVEWAQDEVDKRKPKTPDKPKPETTATGAKPKEKLRSGAASGDSGLSREDLLSAVLGKHRK